MVLFSLLLDFTEEDAGESGYDYSSLKLMAFEDEFIQGNSLQGMDLETLQVMNEDAEGWLEIPGTSIDCPVMNSSKYRSKDFLGANDQNGTPYLGEGANLSQKNWNSIIYGNAAAEGSEFSDLDNYKEETFWKSNDTFKVWTEYGTESYQIFAVAEISSTESGESSFDYSAYTDLSDENTCKEFLVNIEKNKLYDTGVVASYGDSFVTLSGYGNDETVALFAKQMS